MVEPLILKIAAIMLVFHLMDTLSYGIRLNAVKSGQFALSTSLFNTISMVTRISTMFLQPAVGLLVGVSISQHVNPILGMRQIILGATLGACLGGLLMPTFLKLFDKAVKRLEATGSVPALLFQAFTVANIRRMPTSVTLPGKRLLSGLRFRQIPKRLLLINVVVTGVYTVGLLAANYAAVFVPPENRLAVVGASGLINGVATILVTLLVDPKTALMTDQAMRGERSYGDVKALVTLLLVTKIVGTLLGQLIFVPSAHFIALFYQHQ